MKEGRQVKESKIKAVDELIELLKKYRVTGIISLRKTPAVALQKIKTSLKNRALIRTSRKSTILFAFEKVGKKNLKDFVTVSPALILTNEDPFKIYLALEKSKTLIYAKPRDVAPEDIIVKEGPTDIPAGPAISTLTKIALPAKIVGGTISILKDKVVCKAGEAITADVASALQLLKMKTMRVGLNVVVMEEDEKIYTKEQLFIDQERLLDDMKIASMNALNLSLNVSYPTKENIQIMLAMAHLNAKEIEREIESKNAGQAAEKKEEPAVAGEQKTEV